MFPVLSLIHILTDSISFLEEQLKSIKEKILQVEEAMEQLIAASCSLCTNYLLLRSIKGVGIINAIVLLCVTNNFQRFDNPRKFACYCGVAPFEHTSGISIRGKMCIRDSRLTIPKGNLYDDLYFRYSVKEDSTALGATHILHNKPVAFHKSAKLSLRLQTDTLENKQQYGIVLSLIHI